MTAWDQRPIEIRNLFNPAFCGLVLFRALRAFEEEDDRGMPFSLTLLVLPLSLQKEARDTLLRGKRRYFLSLVSANPQMLVGFANRATTLLPFTFEALGLLMQLGTILAQPDGRLITESKGVRKSETGSAETVECQRVARFLGKQFAAVGDAATIYTTLGVRP